MARLKAKLDSHHEELMVIMKADQEKNEAMMRACVEKTKATDLVAYPEETESEPQHQKSLRKRTRWKLWEHWRTDTRTSI
jgi:hypothetical protein